MGVIRAFLEWLGVLNNVVLVIPTMKPLDKGQGNNQAEATPEVAPVSVPAETPAEPEKIDFSNVVIEPLFEDQVDFETFSKSDFGNLFHAQCCYLEHFAGTFTVRTGDFWSANVLETSFLEE